MPESVDDKQRLSGPRGDFVASLGRRLQTLRGALKSLEQEPGDISRRNALLRRAHALGASARVLGFASVAEALAGAERAVGKGQQLVSAAELAEVSRVLDVLPSLVGGAPLSMRPPGQAIDTADELSSRQWPLSLLLFGGEELEGRLTRAVKRDNVEFERASDVERAAQIARVLGPDLLLIDADAPRANEFFERVQRDDLTEPVSSIFVGDFKDPAEPQRLTVLGVTRVLKEPVSPETLRRTIEELCQSPLSAGDTGKPFGQLTVKGLAERLAEELERGLVQATHAGTQGTHVDFGDGTDVMAAVWGTVTRVRELVTARSQGAVRFEPIGPEGAIALAPWGERERRAGERGARSGRDESQVSLSGRTVVVVDDDPAVTWFLSGLLKTVGAQVLEAYDGVEALDLARSRWPDLIVSDVLMPKLDGFSLCREIKRDVAVRDTPVILLSWKEDLLQRMRELGADADGYLRKEAAASTVVQRIREVMRPRARVEARLRQGGEVRGRLDGLTPRLILELCCKSKQDLRVEFRDAFFKYVLQVRRGRLLQAERQRGNGERREAETALRSLLGVSAGRFLVVPDKAAVTPQFEEDLLGVVAPFVDQARSWQRAFTSLPLTSIERVGFDGDELNVYCQVAPALVRDLVDRLASGVGPNALLLDGTAAPDLLLHTLLDLARRGVVTEVEGADGPWSKRSIAAVAKPRDVGPVAPSQARLAAIAEPAHEPAASDETQRDGASELVEASERARAETGGKLDASLGASADPVGAIREPEQVSSGSDPARSPNARRGLSEENDRVSDAVRAIDAATVVAGDAGVDVKVSSPQAAPRPAFRRTATPPPQPNPEKTERAASVANEKLAPERALPVAEGGMDSLDPKHVSTDASSKAAFSFQLSPEPPRAEVADGRKQRSHLPPARPVAPSEEVDDAGWFGSSLYAEPPLALGTAAASDSAGASDVLSEAATRTPPPAEVRRREDQHEPADPLAETAVSTATPGVFADAGQGSPLKEHEPEGVQQQTPASGQQIAALLSGESADPPVAQRPPQSPSPPQAVPLPATKSIEFPSRAARLAAVVDSGRGSPEVPRAPARVQTPAPAELAAPAAAYSTTSESTQTRAEPREEPVAPTVDDSAVGSETPAAFEQPATPVPSRLAPTPKGMRAAPAARDTTGTLKVIGYALVAMVFSYLGMSALVAWFGEPAGEQAATLERATGEASAPGQADQSMLADDSPAAASGAEAVPLGKAAPSVAKASSEAKEQSAKAAKFVVTDMPLPAGLAIGKDKGVLKIATPDAHTIYVDDEFAGRGPIRIVPLPPGKHTVKTRYEGTERSFAAEVKAGRMTRLSLTSEE